jgi:hypothetical protein
LARILILAAAIIGVAGGGLVAYRSFFRLGPGTPRQDAPPSTSRDLPVDPDGYRVETVARRQRDGALRVEDGKGTRIPAPGLLIPDLTRQSAWLDEVSVGLSSREPFETIEVRVLDHATGALLGEGPWAGAGWRAEGTRIEIRRVGALLPERLDLSLRVARTPRSDIVHRIPAHSGGSAETAIGSLSMRELRRGSWTYSRGRGGAIEWTRSAGDEGAAVTAVFDLRPGGEAPEEKFQVWAVTKDSRRIVPDSPHFLSPDEGGAVVVVYELPLEALSHFEARPFRGRDAFTFEDVRLPRVGGTLSPPPAALVPIGGKEVEVASSRLFPIALRVRAMAGVGARGVVGKAGGGAIEAVEGPRPDIESKTTVTYELSGATPERIEIEVLDPSGVSLPAPVPVSGRTALPGRYVFGYVVLEIPLARLGSIRLSLPVPTTGAGAAPPSSGR